MLLLFGVSTLCMSFAIAYIENAIVGTPKVMCAENDLGLDITTLAPFRGNIFVKGRAKEKSCRKSYADGSNNTYSLPLGQCGMQRLRSANPRGVHFSVTVIVSFHPSGFITKNDRAFHVKCFYTEPEEVVTSQLEVSQLATTELLDDMPMPSCEYSVRRDGPHGPVLSFANVFHVWECNGAEMGMLVKKCAVTDGEGDEHSVVTAEGCSTDSALLSDLTYDVNLMRAHATSQTPISYISHVKSDCVSDKWEIAKGLLLLTPLTGPSFDRIQRARFGPNSWRQMSAINPLLPPAKRNFPKGSDFQPPQCGETIAYFNRSRRAVSTERKSLELDVATRSLLILDAEDASRLRGAPSAALCLSPRAAPLVPLGIIALCALSSVITFCILQRPAANFDTKQIE